MVLFFSEYKDCGGSGSAENLILLGGAVVFADFLMLFLMIIDVSFY